MRFVESLCPPALLYLIFCLQVFNFYYEFAIYIFNLAQFYTFNLIFNIFNYKFIQNARTILKI